MAEANSTEYYIVRAKLREDSAPPSNILQLDQSIALTHMYGPLSIREKTHMEYCRPWHVHADREGTEQSLALHHFSPLLLDSKAKKYRFQIGTVAILSTVYSEYKTNSRVLTDINDRIQWQHSMYLLASRTEEPQLKIRCILRDPQVVITVQGIQYCYSTSPNTW